MAGFRIEGNTSGNVVEVNASNQLKIIPETNAAANPANVGAVLLFGENDPGSITGTPYIKSPEISSDYRMRVGVDSVWDDDNFNYTAQNSSKHKYTSNTLTMTWAGGFLNTNGASATTTATGCQIQTYRSFPLQGGGGVYCEVAMALSAAIPTNLNLDFGLFLPAAASTSLPLDGVYFRVNSSGVLGVLNNNGTETTTSAFTFTPSTNRVYKFNLSISDSEVEFWIDDVLYGELPKPNNTGSVFYGGSCPFAIRHHHTGVTSSVMQGKFANYTIGVADMDNVRLWATNKTGQGLSGIQGPSGYTQGQTANFANSAAATSATLSNTAAGYATLGGRFQFAAVAGAETDYALFGYLNLAQTTSITGRNLIVRGVWIETINTGAAVATTATVLEWALGAGSTAVSLATTEAAAARAPRRLALGIQSFAVGAAIGAQASRVDVNLDAPITVEPGTYLHIILKMPVGTATASQVIRGMVGINAYWE
jgi:hypothetical protein